MNKEVCENMSCTNHTLYLVYATQFPEIEKTWELVPLILKEQDNNNCLILVGGGDYMTPKGCSGLSYNQAMALAHTYLADKESRGEFGHAVRIEKVSLDFKWELKHTGNFIEVQPNVKED